ncbi:MAG: hypothetical protein KF760_27330 [Candidatus Eremiobacteraeota bacterium]|nr:hypothetical protein [Candidatus Eremiobacteraeota bacterium]MCW5869876.1 hypothetical protein [Candidatus Eremiobacteraeota bacterium]
MLRRILLALLVLALAAALLGGLARLWGFALPAALIAHHGLLMGGILLPTLISLERAVALSTRWSWTVPWLGLACALCLLADTGPTEVLLLGLGGGLLVQHLALARRRPGLDARVSLLAVSLLLVSDARWVVSHNAPECAPGWASFLILLIGAERIELSFLGNARAPGLHWLLLGLGLSALAGYPQGQGLGWLSLAVWLARHDLARRNAFRAGLAAYSGRAVLSGYFWLALSGGQLALTGLPYAGGLAFDRITHGVFVGFVLSMILAHGPIVLPAVARCGMRFSRTFYIPLVLLHLSLALRWLGWTALGAAGNLAALAIFGPLLLRQTRSGKNPWLADRPA